MTRVTLPRLGILALLLVLGGSLHGVAGPSRAQGEQQYLALGDSIPAGLASTLPSERSYPALLRELMRSQAAASPPPAGVQLTNLAVPGETAQSFVNDGQLESAIDEIEAADELGLVTLTIGGNNMLSLRTATDAERETGLEEFTQAYQQTIDELSAAVQGTGADVVVTTYYDLTEGDPDTEGTDSWWLAQFNQVIEQNATEAGFAVVDLAEMFEGRISELTWFPADIHPNNAGHEAIAEGIWQELEYDQDEPDVEITRPDEGEADSRVLTIHASLNDGVGVETAEIVVADEVVGDLLYVSDRDAWIGIWDAREFDGASAELTVVATDRAANEGTDTVTVSLPPR